MANYKRLAERLFSQQQMPGSFLAQPNQLKQQNPRRKLETPL